MTHICPKCQKRYGFLDQLKGAEVCSECAAAEQPATAEVSPRSGIPMEQHAVAALPLVLMFVGGLLGGLCGGAAYALSVSVFKKNLPTPRKYVYSLLISAGAVAVYFGVILLLIILFPSLFQKP